MGDSSYFNKHYDASMQKQFIIGDNRTSAADLAQSLQEGMNVNHFDESMDQLINNPDEVLDENDVDDSMFIFPDREQEETKEELLAGPELDGALKSTADLLGPVIERNL